eukprot:s1736_g25.t1
MVITLYKPQAALLQDALAKALDPRRMAFIKVVTVDAAQGSEAPHIVLSTVRSNSARSIGFAHNHKQRAMEMMERSASKGKGKGKGQDKGGKGKGMDVRPCELGDHWSHRGHCQYGRDLRY